MTEIAPQFSEDALALTFTQRHQDDLRFVNRWGRWFRWNGHVWQADETVHAFDLSRMVCREAASQCNKYSVSKALASAKTVAAVEKLARADRQHAATVDQWDGNLWLLSTPNCAIDLRSGETRPNRREDYSTKITAVAPSGDCPNWLDFLNRVTDGDDQLIAFLRRMAGYSLTGITREHALFFLYGTGANGKTTFVNALAGCLGDYHTTSSTEVFTVDRGERHPTELANLRGARLVTVTETEEGRRWAEARIKALTGGDPISARFMKQDFFEFTPTFKLVIAGNHKPQLRNVDEAFRRRLHLIPFTVTIPPEERDETLPERLKAEWPGILQWMIDGCLAWQEGGLAPPERVLEATKEYLSAEDAIELWIDDRCHRGPDYKTSTSELYASFKTWSEEAGEHVISQKRFSQNLEAHGYQRSPRLSTGRKGFEGLCPKTNYEE